MSEELLQYQPELTGIALAYTNKTFISDKIFPQIKVSKDCFSYKKYDKTSLITVPETRIGEKGTPNSIDLKGVLLTAKVEDHALIEEIPVKKVEQNENIRQQVTMQLTDVLKAGQEIELSQILGNASNYAGNTKTLGNDEKITKDTVNAVDLIQDSIDEMFLKANTMVISRRAFSKLRRNPYVVGAVNKNSSTSGKCSIEGIKELFEIDNLYVGESVVNTAKKGQSANYCAAWDDNIILLHLNPIADTEFGVTFGYRVTLDDITVGSYLDSSKGTKGCEVLKAYTSYKNLITCPECGYLLKGVI